MIEKYRRILIVDDDRDVRRLFRRLFDNYETRDVESGEEALNLLTQWRADLVLLDIMLPNMDGYEVCRRIKETCLSAAPEVVMVSSKSTSAEQSKAFECGADDYMIKPVDPGDLKARIATHLRLIESREQTAALQLQLDGHNAALRKAAKERLEQTLAVQDVAVFTLAKICELRDDHTGDHITRMREYSQCIAEELFSSGEFPDEIDETFLADLYRSTPLHDIGKVGIPDSILMKPGKLTAEEFETMKRHTVMGGRILRDAVLELNAGGFLTMAAKVAEFHHERWDGSGYPAGFQGVEIPLPARIVAVADVYDALTSERPYKEEWTPESARAAIVRASGTQFDATVVAAFERCTPRLIGIQERHRDRNQVVQGAMAFSDMQPLEAVMP